MRVFTALMFHVFLAVALPVAGRAADPAPENSAVATWQTDKSTIFDAGQVTLEEFKWIARPVVVFADSPADPAFQEQMELIASDIGELALRDVVVITDTNPAAKTEAREALRPRGFNLTLVGKDGRVALRKPFPWHVRELGRAIDKMPMRLQEIRAKQEGG